MIFTYPASAQLAARLDGRDIDLSVIDRATAELERRYDMVLIEGAGGLMVPITDTFCTLDYVSTRQLPVALVTNSRLGSINHTLLSLEALRARAIHVPYILYNTYFDRQAGELIAADTRDYIRRYVDREMPGTKVLDIPVFQ